MFALCFINTLTDIHSNYVILEVSLLAIGCMQKENQIHDVSLAVYAKCPS